MKIGPISPKAHGAWLGAGSGAAVANEIITLVQTYAHTTLPQATVALAYTIVPAAIAFLGAWLAPLLPTSMSSSVKPQTAGVLDAKIASPPSVSHLGAPPVRPLPTVIGEKGPEWPMTSGGSAT